MSEGVSEATFPNTWLSVITSAGFLPSCPSTSFNSFSFTTTETASASKMSRMVCCWGRISLPFGAALSIGTTSTAISEGFRRSRTIYRSGSSVSAAAAICSFNSLIPPPVAALTKITCGFPGCGSSVCPVRPWTSSELSPSTVFLRISGSASSFLFTATTYGIFFSLIRFSSAISSGAAPQVPSMTSTATSVLLST